MTQATHTQGPWGVNDLAAKNANVYLTGLDGTKSPLGYIVQTENAPIAAMIETKADARLIAAAPDLLAALTAVTDCLLGFHASDDFGPSDTEALNVAIAAIAKAQAQGA